jgi:peptidoglycan/LPS O-acetylase OafA/YrhL
MDAPSKKQTFHTLDALRGVAAITVIVYHFTVYTTGMSIFTAGQFAVDLFYGLSGFVIAHSYEQRMRDGMTTATFLKIRMIRFYPYYVLGALLGIGHWLMQRLRTNDILAHSITIKAFLFSVFTTLCFLPSSGLTTREANNLFPFNFPTWSLFLELVMNILYIAAVYRLATRQLMVLVTALGIALAALIFHYHSTDIGFTHSTFMGGVGRAAFSFFMGVLLRRLWRPQFAVKCSYLCLLLTFLICLSIPRTRAVEPYYDLFIITAVMPSLVFLGAILKNGNAQIAPIFRFFGQTSYGLYALHAPIFALFVLFAPSHFSALGPITSLSLGFVALALLAALVQQLNVRFDQPLRKVLTRTFLSGAQPVSATQKIDAPTKLEIEIEAPATIKQTEYSVC